MCSWGTVELTPAGLGLIDPEVVNVRPIQRIAASLGIGVDDRISDHLMLDAWHRSGPFFTLRMAADYTRYALNRALNSISGPHYKWGDYRTTFGEMLRGKRILILNNVHYLQWYTVI